MASSHPEPIKAGPSFLAIPTNSNPKLYYMSLNLSDKFGITRAIAPITSAWPVDADLEDGDFLSANKATIPVDTSAGEITITPGTNLTGTEDGDEMTFIKATSDSNKLAFNDPYLSILFDYMDRQGESITLVFDADSGQWFAKI